MNGVIRDKYILGESNDNSIIKANDEIEMNLVLSPNLNNIKLSKITGNVCDLNGNTIENSIIKLESRDKSFRMQARTDYNGRYTFEDIPEDFYTLSIWAKGMLVKKTSQFQVVGLLGSQMDFTLEWDLKYNTSIITGDVFDIGDNAKMYNVCILLFQIQEDRSRNLKALAYSNKFGQFAFREVSKGNYFLIFNIHGYTQSFTNLSIVESHQIVSLKINMVQDKSKASEIIAGVISDSYGNPISGAYVSLYPIISDEKSSNSIAVTITNQDGIYVFSDIPKGSYKITYANG